MRSEERETLQEYAAQIVGPDFLEIVGWNPKKILVRIGQRTEFNELKNVRTMKIARPEILVKEKTIKIDDCPKCGNKMVVHGGPSLPFLKCEKCGNIVF